ncbi:uncharacterized protein LOC126378394 [Pectinophora gossypiella]|nr:uncharacterized protein LOC126378393 [Pectinophora gossypiella]XP_049882676.1 uncharacterized protein LOC126378393 [Pectinophora gossypiella]XP_049882677.1 uncharacterized protein LOC126378394 [Pectinophora gossypiella]
MSEFKTPRLHEEDLLSQSSDEKMDTGSESFRSQDTPNSILSSDFEDKSESNVLRLQNPGSDVLRLSEPEKNDNLPKITQKDLSDSFVKKMSNLHLDSPLENRPKHLGISPPKFSSSLVLTTNHPLMVSSPDDYPDVIPKKAPKGLENEEKDLSLSSIEDERAADTNGYEFYSPHMNTSKNNLYFSENFTTAESNMLSDSKIDFTPPDVARIDQQRRKIIPRFVETPRKLDNASRKELTPHRVLGRVVDGHRDDSAISKYIEERNKKLSNHSTPKPSQEDADVAASRVAEWCESTHIRTAPNFDLPIELSTNIAITNDLGSPDVISSSTQEDKSAYQALLDPYTGSVALRPSAQRNPSDRRRKIQLPPEEDRCSLDSVSVSMDSEDEPPEPPEIPEGPEDRPASDDDTKRSRSSNTCSECSDPIPEYSAAEEYHNERSYITVKTGHTHTTCDMKVIEPYKRVLSHGGYDAQGSAIIVFSACHLPDTARPDYRYVMDNLFLYVVWSLERLIGEDYVLIYLHGSAGARRLPTFRWLHECYRLIDRRLRKSLKHLYLVHPTFWLKSFVVLTKPFVSSKFFRKLSYVSSLEQLSSLVPVEPNAIPDLVRQFDQRR